VDALAGLGVVRVAGSCADKEKNIMKNYLKTALTALAWSWLTACISHAPRELAPALDMSPENFAVSAEPVTAPSATGVDFGFESTINESDGLSNITVLPGVRVRSVRAGGPADLAGIQTGDVVLAIDAIPTDHPDALARIALSTTREQEFAFEVRRDTTVFAATVVAIPVTETASRLEELYRADPLASRAGYRTQLVNTTDRGTVTAAEVLRYFPLSPLPQHDVQIGDHIVAVNGQPVASAQGLVTSFNRDFAPGAQVELTLVRNNAVLLRDLTLRDPGRRVSQVSLGPLLRYEASVDPDRTQLSILDLWLLSLFSYNREGQEKNYSMLGLFKFSSGLEGELATE
jgi:predicted metalloprotease with PDZ domain